MSVRINTLCEEEIRSIARNGFEVKNSKQLNSTIPMVYVEATKK